MNLHQLATPLCYLESRLLNNASARLFEIIPPFPDDVPTTPMHTITLADLSSNSEPVARALRAAYQELGLPDKDQGRNGSR
jgi:hypothetical protein